MPVETMPWKEPLPLTMRLRYQCRLVAPLVAEIEHHVQHLRLDVKEVEISEDDVVVTEVTDVPEEDMCE